MKTGTSQYYKNSFSSSYLCGCYLWIPLHWNANSTGSVLWNQIKICAFMSMTPVYHRTVVHVTDTEYCLCLITHCNDDTERCWVRCPYTVQFSSPGWQIFQDPSLMMPVVPSLCFVCPITFLFRLVGNVTWVKNSFSNHHIHNHLLA